MGGEPVVKSYKVTLWFDTTFTDLETVERELESLDVIGLQYMIEEVLYGL